MITKGELKRLQKLGSSHVKLSTTPKEVLGPNCVYEVVVVNRKGKQETIGQKAASSREARRKLEREGVKVLKVKKLNSTIGKELAFVLNHRIYNGIPYQG